MVIERRAHLVGVVRPIGGQPQYAVVGEYPGNAVKELRLDEPTFMVAVLGPRIREEHPYLTDGSSAQHVVQDFWSVRFEHTYIGDVFGGNAVQKFCQAAPVHFHSEEISVMVTLCAGRGRFAMTDAHIDD